MLTARSVMQQPRVAVVGRDGPRAALKLMEEQGLSSVFVVDREHRLVGLVQAEAAIGAAQHGETSLSGLIIRDVPTTRPDTLLEALIPVAASHRWPIAVLDEERRLLGIIPRVAVLAGLAGRTEAEAPRQAG